MTNPASAPAAFSIVRAAMLLGFRVLDRHASDFLPRGTRIITRTTAVDAVAYIWADGSVSAGSRFVGSFSDPNAMAVAHDIVPARLIHDYLDAMAAQTLRTRHVRGFERSTILAGLIAYAR